MIFPKSAFTFLCCLPLWLRINTYAKGPTHHKQKQHTVSQFTLFTQFQPFKNKQNVVFWLLGKELYFIALLRDMCWEDHLLSA